MGLAQVRPNKVQKWLWQLLAIMIVIVIISHHDDDIDFDRCLPSSLGFSLAFELH